MADIYFREAATQLFEAWSDAARAAAAAGRSGRGKGKATRASAARAAFAKAGGKRRPDWQGESIRRSQHQDKRQGMYPDYGPRKSEKAAYKKAVSFRKERRAALGVKPRKAARRRKPTPVMYD
jgi:hypothetical protein